MFMLGRTKFWHNCNPSVNIDPNHTGCHLFQPRTGNWDYNSYKLTKIGPQKNWKNSACSDESQFQLQHLYGRVRIWHEQHKSMYPSRLVSTAQAGGGGVMLWGISSWHTLGPKWASFRYTLLNSCHKELRQLLRQMGNLVLVYLCTSWSGPLVYILLWLLRF